MINKDVATKEYWALSVPEIIEVLETGENGLTEEIVDQRRKVFGRNTIPEKPAATKLRILLSQFQSPLILLLLAAGLITIIVQDYKEAAIILAAALLNALLGFYQENKAENALAHLKSYVKERVKVIRGDSEFEIDASELVPGDAIHLS